MITESLGQDPGLNAYCSWLKCPVCGGRVFMGEPVGALVASVECHGPMHYVDLTPVALPPPRSLVGSVKLAVVVGFAAVGSAIAALSFGSKLAAWCLSFLICDLIWRAIR